MNKEKDIIRKGKHLAFLLRHDQEAFDDGRTAHDCSARILNLDLQKQSKFYLPHMIVRQEYRTSYHQQ